MKKLCLELNNYVIFFAVILTLCIAPYGAEKFLAKPFKVQIDFMSADPLGEGAVEKAIISDISGGCTLGDTIKNGDFTFEEEKGRFVLERGNEGSFTFDMKSTQFLSFILTFRLTSENASLNGEKYIVSQFMNEKLVNKEEILLNNMYDTKVHCIYWQDCGGLFLFYTLFFVFAAYIVVITKRLFYKYSNTNVQRFIAKVFVSPYLYIVLFAISWYVTLGFFMPSYTLGGDAENYYIASLSELSWYHRMPGCQLLYYAIGKVVGGEDFLTVCPYIVKTQIVLSVISIVAFFDALRKILKSNILASVFSIVYVIVVGVFGWTQVINSESVAVSMMCIMIWLIVQITEKKSVKYVVGSSLFAIICILTRPSFLFLLPLLLLFYFIYGLKERKKKVLKWGIGSIFVGILLLLIYCGNNERLTGHFMLCDVSYHNQCSIMLMGNMYENSNYPRITEEAINCVRNRETPLKNAEYLCRKYGYKYIAEYLRDCRKMYAKEYLEYMGNTVLFF